MKRKPMMKNFLCLTTSLALLSACQPATGEQYESNVYEAGEVNQEQDARTVKILAVMPAKVQVENKKQRKTAQLVGGVLGALGGALAGNQSNKYRSEATLGGAAGGGAIGATAGGVLVDEKVLVDGVSITYVDNGKTKNSAQVGKLCQFIQGTAVLITTKSKETRIQPNATCPVVTQ